MPGEGPRVARSPLSPRARVRLTALADGGIAVDILCASCQRYHLALAEVADSGSCHSSDFRPAGAAAFVGTHHADEFYRPVATTDARAAADGPDPVDLL